MKTYTFTWRHAFFHGQTLSRVRFDSLCIYWNPILPNDKLLQFMSLIVGHAFCIASDVTPCCRLIKCGKLIARQATYQGV